MGIIVAKENRVRIVESILKKRFNKKYFLYGGTNLTSSFNNSLNIISVFLINKQRAKITLYSQIASDLSKEHVKSTILTDKPHTNIISEI